MAGERRAATTRAAGAEAARVDLEGRVAALGRELAAARAETAAAETTATEATNARMAAELREEETRDALRAARGDASSAAAATLEMEKRVSASRRSAAEARMRLEVGTASKEFLSTRLREREEEAAEREAELKALRDASREAERDAETRRVETERRARRAEEAAEAARAEAAAARRELAEGAERHAAALGAAADAEKRADRWRDRVDKLLARLFPEGGAPSEEELDAPDFGVGGDEANDAASPAKDSDATVSSDRTPSSGGLVILRATLRGHPCGEDVDVTASVRRRAATTGNRRLEISTRENIRETLLREQWPATPRRAFANGDFDEMDHRHVANVHHRDATASGELLVEYATSSYFGARARVERPSSSEPSPSSGEPSSIVAVVGGVCTKSPFLVHSVRVDAAPVAADVAARDANRRVLDAEATAAEARARAVAAETTLAETRAALAASVASVAESTAETTALRAALDATRKDAALAANEVERLGDDASRAERAAESARALARRKVAEARAAADRRVAEAARDERLRAERRARETRLANAAARRGVRGAWGDPPEDRTPSGASFFGAETTASPRDAAYKTRAKANDAARAEALAWAAAREMAAADVEPTRAYAHRAKARDRLRPNDGFEGDEGDEGDAISASASFYVAARESGSRFGRVATPASAAEAKRRAEARVRAAREGRTYDPAEDEDRSRAAPRTSAADRVARATSTSKKTKTSGPASASEPSRLLPRFTAAERRAADNAPSVEAKLRRAESELRSARADAAEASTLRARVVAAERAAAERDARLAAAHRRAAIALAASPTATRANAPERRDAAATRALATGLIAASRATLASVERAPSRD